MNVGVGEVRRLDLAIGAIVIVAMAAVAGVTMSGLVDTTAAIGVSCGAGIVAVIASIAATLLARRADGRRLVAGLLIAAALSAALIALTVAAAWPSPAAPDDGFVNAAIGALRDGWTAWFTSPVPTDAEPDVLVPFALTVHAAAFVAAGVLVRRGLRPEITLPGLAAVFVCQVATGGRNPHPIVIGLSAAAIVGVAFCVAEASRTAQRNESDAGRQAALQRSVGTVIIVAVAAIAAATILGPALTFGREREPFDPRTYVERTAITQTAMNPIELVAGWLGQPDTVLFTVEAAEPLPTRLVALDAFDGARWTVAGDFVPTGSALSPDLRAVIPVESEVATIELADLPGPWRPTVADTRRVTGAAMLLDRSTASLAAADDALVYELEAAVPLLDDPSTVDTLRGLPANHDPDAPASSAALIDPPDWVREMADAATGGATAPYVQSARIEAYLRSNFEVTDRPVGGHSYGQIERTLLGGTDGQPGVASAEQFASAFAIVGRSLGLPTRVVVGFDGGTEVAPGQYEVSADDVRVWPEVRFVDAGWVPFDPVPSDSATVAEVAADDLAAGDGTGDGSGSADLPDAADDPATDEPNELAPSSAEAPVNVPVADAPDAESNLTRIAVYAMVPVGTIVLVLVAIVLLKRRATARRRCAEHPRERAIGAWHDVRERMVEFGVEPSADLTVEETIDAGGPNAAALVGLYRSLNQALYGDDVDDEDGELAWKSRDRYVAACRRDRSIVGRLRSSVDPRPITRSRRRSSASAR